MDGCHIEVRELGRSSRWLGPLDMEILFTRSSICNPWRTMPNWISWPRSMNGQIQSHLFNGCALSRDSIYSQTRREIHDQSYEVYRHWGLNE